MVGCYCYDTRLWLEIVDEWIKNAKLKYENWGNESKFLNWVFSLKLNG